MAAPDTFKFIKMHGLGNDFIIIDTRTSPEVLTLLTPMALRHLADRRLGIGCDQFMVLSKSTVADAYVHIYNHDGTEVKACGNGSRCVAGFLGRQNHNDDLITLETAAGILKATIHPNKHITIDIGMAKLEWQDIPLSGPAHTDNLEFNLAQLHPKGAQVFTGRKPLVVNVGNPHIVFFVNEVASVDLKILGPLIENDPLFPERINVSFAQILQPNHILLRVWERGAGATLACGTAACAVVVAAHRAGLNSRKAQVYQPGGILEVEWLPNQHVQMTGPVAVTFEGTIDPSLLHAQNLRSTQPFFKELEAT